MADDKVAIWGSGLKFGRKPANGELLIGNGEDMTMATLTAGAGASITNAAGAITISATGTGIGTVTASSPLASSGGSSPDISLTGTVGVANGGTGRSSLTANNVILGNGTSAVGLVAPGASGNVLTSDGTTWASVAPTSPRGYILIQSISSGGTGTITFSSIPSTYAQLWFFFKGVSFGNAAAPQMQVEFSTNNGATFSAATTITNAVAAANTFDGFVQCVNYAETSMLKTCFMNLYTPTVNAIVNNALTLNVPTTVTGVINAVRFSVTASGTFDAGLIDLKGL
jgi:hypothetical protein